MSWVDRVFAGLCVLVAGYFVARLVFAGRGAERSDRIGDLAQLAMGVGMAAMFLPAADPLSPAAWIGLFVVIGAWIAAGLLRSGPGSGHQVHLVVSIAAMVYMLAMVGAPVAEQVTAIALPAPGSVVLAHDHGAGGLDGATLATGLATYFLLHALWSGGRVLRGGDGTGPGGLFSPRLTGFCHVVMGLGMGYMFATTLLP